MKLFKLSVFILIISFGALNLSAQDKPQSVLKDEFGQIASGDLKARVDSFVIELSNQRDAKGYIISYASPEVAKQYQDIITDHLKMRNVPLKRFVFLNGRNSVTPVFQFWLVLKGAEPPKINKPGEIVSLDLSETEVNLSCPSDVDKEESVQIRASAVDAENDALTYTYTVSGGRILGQGAKVEWDLSGAFPGTYTITVGVDDGKGFSEQPKTQSLDVRSTHCPPETHECPTLSVMAPPGAVEPGEMMTFTAVVSGGDQREIIYSWTIDKGSIIAGQGTPSIKVSSDGLENETVTATVSIRGGFLDDCNVEESETGIISSKPKLRLVDEFSGNWGCEDMFARMDGFAVQLQNKPRSKGYIVTTAKKGDSWKVLSTVSRLKSFLILRGYGESFTFVNAGTGGQNSVEFWLVPEDADSSSITKRKSGNDLLREYSERTEPFILETWSQNEFGGCSHFGLSLSLYAEILKANPQMRGNVVIKEKSQKNFRDREKELLDELTAKGISRNRLKTFFEQTKPDNFEESIELWLLP